MPLSPIRFSCNRIQGRPIGVVVGALQGPILGTSLSEIVALGLDRIFNDLFPLGKIILDPSWIRRSRFARQPSSLRDVAFVVEGSGAGIRIISSRIGYGTLTRLGCVRNVTGSRVLEGQIHGVFPIIQVDHLDRDVLDCRGVGIVGKNLESACSHRSRSPRKNPCTRVERHPGRKVVSSEMSWVARSLDPVVERFAFGRRNVSRTGDRRSYFTGAVTEQVRGGLVHVGGSGPSGAFVKRIGKTNATDRTGATSSVGETDLDIEPSGLTEIKMRFLHRIPRTVVNHNVTIDGDVSSVIDVFAEGNFP